MKHAHLIHHFSSDPWAMLPEKLHAMISLVELRIEGLTLSPDLLSQLGARQYKSKAATGNIAVIPIRGTIAHRDGLLLSFFGGTSIESFREQFRSALTNPNVGAIVLDIDSPGGTTSGVEELHDEIYEARKKKRIIAAVNTLGASAAYWLASAANEIAVTPSGHVGAIGVLGVHMDLSEKAKAEGINVTVVSAGRYKAEHSEFTPMSDGARAHLQSIVNDRYDAFVRSVARGRNVPHKAVRNGFGEGRLVTARDALSMGMVDSVETIDQVIVNTVRRASNAKKISEALSWRPEFMDASMLGTVTANAAKEVSAQEEAAFMAQTLIAPKGKWSSVDVARDWARANGYRVDKVEETESAWRFRQRDAADFHSLRTICVNPGREVSPTADESRMLLVGGRLKAGATMSVAVPSAEGVDEFLQSGVVPSDVSQEIAPEGTTWKKPALSDFTSKTWEELTDSEKRRIAMHAAWADAMPPSTFGAIKLFHHNPSNGAVNPNGVRNALARLNQTEGLGGDASRVEAHLRSHMSRIQDRRDRALADPKLNPRQVELELLELG